MQKRRRAPARGVGRPAGERGKDTEKAILDAAESIFARVGYSGARTQEIASQAGVTKAMIHYYFDSKERLYRAVLDRILFELIKLVQEVSSSARGRIERMDAFVGGFFDYLARHPQFGRLTFLGSGDEHRYFDAIVTGFFRPLFARGVRFIEEGVGEKLFRSVDAPQLLLSVYAVTMGYLADARFISLLLEREALSAESLRARRDALIDMLHRTLGVAAARPPPH